MIERLREGDRLSAVSLRDGERTSVELGVGQVAQSPCEQMRVFRALVDGEDEEPSRTPNVVPVIVESSYATPARSTPADDLEMRRQISLRPSRFPRRSGSRPRASHVVVDERGPRSECVGRELEQLGPARGAPRRMASSAAAPTSVAACT